MSQGSQTDDEEGKKGAPDLFANVPGYQPVQEQPVWPGQKPSQPAQAQPQAQPQSSAQSQAQSQPQPGESGQQLAFHQGAPQLQLPTKPKIQNKPNLAMPGQGQGQTQPGQPNAGFTPPTPFPVQANPGFVPAKPVSQVGTGGPRNLPRPTAPIISSASAKPNWTQPQWPDSTAGQTAPKTGGGLTAARAPGGNRLPPAVAPQPQAPYSQAPPNSGVVTRNLFGAQQGQNQTSSPEQLAFSRSPNQTTQGLKSQVPFTIQRDLNLTKQLFDGAVKPLITNQRNTYKQTEYIPKAPKLKVAAPDPERPWAPVPAATYEFFPEEDKPQNPQAQVNQQPSPEGQYPRGFNPANLLAGEEEPQPDPRYAPFQGELLKDIQLQDQRTGLTEDPIAVEKRERGAAALRALGRNSDHYYDNHPGAGGGQDELPPAVRLTSRDLFGLVTYYFIVTKEVLTAPQAFFASMSLVGGLNDPLLYLAFTSVMTGLFACLAKLNLLVFFFSAIYSFFSVAIAAVIMQLAFKKLGGQGKFEQTFNVLAYSRATFIFAWISLGPWPIGLAVATIFTAYLNYLGLSRVHKLPPTTIGLVIGVLTAIPLIVKFAMK